MKKTIPLLIALTTTCAVQAHIDSNSLDVGPHITFEISPSFSKMKYDEYVKNTSFVNEDGSAFGVYAAFTYWDNKYIRFTIDTYLAHTEFNYSSSSGISNGNPNDLFELRGTFGHDFYFKHTKRITPYFGAGYRRFADNSGGMLTNLGAVAYDRRSNYYYSPLGAEISLYNNAPLEIVFIAEYDYLWKGYQKSDDVESKFFEINEQDDGYGYKFRLRFIKQAKNNSKVLLEPFYNYWHVQDSSINCNPFVCVLEPLNKSQEIGIRLGLIY